MRPDFPLSDRSVTHAALVGGAVVAIRPARAKDADAVADLHTRATPASLRDRYLGAPPPGLCDPEGCLDAVPGSCVLVAFSGFRLVGVAQVTGHVPVADVGVLVREGHRRRGLGTILTRHALHVAHVLGHREAVAFGGPENQALRAMLHRLGLEGYTRYTGDLLVTRIPLPYQAEPPLVEPGAVGPGAVESGPGGSGLAAAAESPRGDWRLVEPAARAKHPVAARSWIATA